MKRGQIAGVVVLTLLLVFGLGWTPGSDSPKAKKGEQVAQVGQQAIKTTAKDDQTETNYASVVKELQDMQLKYMSHANDKMFIMVVGNDILDKAAKCPEKSMPDDLRAFIRQLKKRIIVD